MRYIFLLIKIVMLSVVITLVVGGCYLFLMRSSLPSPARYMSGKKADELARAVQAKVKRERWAKTGAIRWSMLDNAYLWDLRRGLVRVQFENYKVLFDVDLNRVQVKEQPQDGPRAGRWTIVKGQDADKISQRAHQLWLRDRFILEPTQSLFDPDVERYIVDSETSNPSLLVHYPKGGPHPKSTFHWKLKDHMPVSIKVWSDQFPIAGFPVDMKTWRILKTGLKVSLRRVVGPFNIDLRVKAASSLTHLVGRTDPFEAIKGDPFDPPPSSQPNQLGDRRGRFRGF
jgi:hypothetical protein